MKVEFLLSADELTAARKLFVKRTQSRVRRAGPWLNVASALLMSALYLSAGFGFFMHSHRPSNPLDFVFLAVWLSLSVPSWYRRDRFAPEPDYGRKQYFLIEEDGIYRESESGESEPGKRVRVPWTKISRYVETDEFFLLYSPWPWGMAEPQSFRLGSRQRPVLYILPKRVLDAGSIHGLTDLLQRRLSVWAKNPALKAETIFSR